MFFFHFFQVLKIRESGKFPGNSREKPRNFLDLEAHPKSNKKLIIIPKVRPKSRKFPGFPGKILEFLGVRVSRHHTYSCNCLIKQIGIYEIISEISEAVKNS